MKLTYNLKSNIYILFLAITFLVSCTKNEETRLGLKDMQTPVVSGFIFTDNNGQEIAHIGNPNVVDQIGTDYRIALFPNPSPNILFVWVDCPQSSSFKRIWIVKARYEGESNYLTNSIQGMSIKPGGVPIIDTITNSNHIEFRSKLEIGVYKLYVEVDDLLMHTNILISEDIFK